MNWIAIIIMLSSMAVVDYCQRQMPDREDDYGSNIHFVWPWSFIEGVAMLFGATSLMYIIFCLISTMSDTQ